MSAQASRSEKTYTYSSFTTTGSVSRKSIACLIVGNITYTAVCLDLVKQVQAGAERVHEFINYPQRLANAEQRLQRVSTTNDRRI